jgi:hypothetical protein
MEVAAAPERVTSCNCSICRRLGALWSYYRPDQVRTPAPGVTTPYVWGDKTLAFRHCPKCGCTTHWTSLDASADRMAVNARIMAIDLSAIPIRYLDGAGAWTEVEAPASRK